MAELTFLVTHRSMGRAGSYRLRVGSNTVVNSVSNAPIVAAGFAAADPTGFFGFSNFPRRPVANGSVKVNEKPDEYRQSTVTGLYG